MAVAEIHWKAPDFRKAGRRAAWQSFSLLFAIVLGIVAFAERSIPFFIFVLIAEFFVLIATRRTSEVIEHYRLNMHGLTLQKETVYLREDIVRFALTDHDEPQLIPFYELVIESRRTRPRRRRILVPHEQAQAVRAFLANQWQIPEFTYEIGAIEFLLRLIGF